jgi:mediator of RNA polymerase II transcription subunit 31
MDATTPPTPLSHRFTLELEFVLCLSNPHYLQYLAVNYPHLLNKPAASHNNSDLEDSDAARFARYLKYLYAYWRTPQYAKYLTHPGATLRNLELIQQEQFRKDMIRPDVIAKLFETEVRQSAQHPETADSVQPIPPTEPSQVVS